MFKRTTLLFIVFLTAASLFAAPLEKRILANGMTVITQEDHSRELVSICTYVSGGSRTETPELSGLTHYFEHLIFRGGTSNQAELEMRKKFLALGKFYGYTFDDGTCYYITVPPENLPEALFRYCDVLLNLELTEKRVETERGIVLEEFSQSYFDVPSGMAYYNLYQTAFTNHPYGQTVIGDSAVVRGATMETFRKFYRERYTPDKFILAAVGDFNTESLLREIEATFGKFPGSGRSFELNKIEPPQNGFRTVNHRMPISQVYFSLGFHILPFSSPEFPALEILDQALFGWPDGVLIDKLRRQSGLFGTLGSWLDRTKDPGLWVIYGDLKPEKAEEAFTTLFSELKNIAINGLTPAEMETAKGALIREYKSSRESLFRRAEALCLYELSSNISLEGQYEERIKSVSCEEIVRLAGRILTPQNATLSLVLPDSMEAPLSAKWGETLRAPIIIKVITKTETHSVEEIILNNGLTLLLQPEPTSEMASMEIFVRGGLWAEPEGLEGTADFLCRILIRGTLEMTGSEFSQMTGRLGLSLSATAEADYCRMSLNSTAEVFLRGVELAGLAFTRPGFNNEDIESIRREILAEIESMGDQTYSLTRQEFNALLYEKNPYQRPIHGYAKSVEGISSRDLKSFHEDVFCGRNIVIAAVGNFKIGEMIGMTEEIFGEIDQGKFFDYKPQKESSPDKSLVKILPKERAQITYNLGWTAPSIKSKDYLQMRLAALMLNKRMFFRFVYEEGICYRMWTRYTDRIGPGKFWFETGISPDNYDFSRTEVLKEFNGFLKEPITEEMLTDAVSESIQRMKLGTETSSDRAQLIAKYYLYGFGPDYLYRYPAMMKGIKAKAVKKAVKKYLKPNKYTMIVVGKVEK